MNEFKANIRQQLFRDGVIVVFIVGTLMLIFLVCAFLWHFGAELCYKLMQHLWGY